MQGVRVDRRRVITLIILPVFLFAVLLLADQLTKYHFRTFASDKVIPVIKDFLEFDFVLNKGSAFSFLADKSWAQTFFKILTPISLAVFVFFYVYAFKKGYKWLVFALSLVICGTIGNYIDRLFFSAVTDFISFKFGEYYFPTFNLADTYLCIGVGMVIVHLLFLDENAILKNGKNDKDNEQDKSES